MKIVWNALKTNGSQFPVSCYIMFHECVGDHFIIHYLIPFHYCICHRCKPTLPLYSFVNQSWRSSQTLKNHVGACTIIIKSFSVFYHNQIRADQKRGRNWNRFLLIIIINGIYKVQNLPKNSKRLKNKKKHTRTMN